jgi:hypothetical protein
MHNAECELERLANKARGGDREAGVALHRALEPQLHFIIRHALHDPTSPFAEPVRREARQVAAASPPGRNNPDQMLLQIEQRVSDVLWRKLVLADDEPQLHLDTLKSA